MNTPYDSALRAQRRDVDALRSAIGDAAGRVEESERQRQAVSEAMARESRLAAGDWTFSPVAYLARARARRERLTEDRHVAETELEALRGEAMERYGSLRALEGAADHFREQAGRDAANAEQSGVDDIAGARFARAVHCARKVRAASRAPR